MDVLTIPELLADLASDSDFETVVCNLENCYLQPLERQALMPSLVDAVFEVRRTMAQARAAIRRLALLGVS